MKILPALLLAAAAAAGVRTAQPSVYKDAVYGFSIQAPAFPAAGPGSGAMPVAFSGPANRGFASNLNVMVQPQAVAADAYLASTREELKAAGLTLLKAEKRKVSGRDALFLEYEGEMQGRALRFMATAVFEPERVLLATATALQADFKAHEAALRASLDSLRLPD